MTVDSVGASVGTGSMGLVGVFVLGTVGSVPNAGSVGLTGVVGSDVGSLGCVGCATGSVGMVGSVIGSVGFSSVGFGSSVVGGTVSTGGGGAGMDTVTAQVAVLPPSLVETIMVAVPSPTALTRPSGVTDATWVLLEVNVTDLSVALEGETVAVNCTLSPIPRRVILSGVSVTDVTATVDISVPLIVILMA